MGPAIVSDLEAQEQTQTDALEKAEKALKNIKEQLQELVDKDFPDSTTG